MVPKPFPDDRTMYCKYHTSSSHQGTPQLCPPSTRRVSDLQRPAVLHLDFTANLLEMGRNCFGLNHWTTGNLWFKAAHQWWEIYKRSFSVKLGQFTAESTTKNSRLRHCRGKWAHTWHCEGNQLCISETNTLCQTRASRGIAHRKLLTEWTNLNSWGLTKESRSCISLKQEPIKKYGPKVLNKALRKEGFLSCFLSLIRTSASSGPPSTWFSTWFDFFMYDTSSFLGKQNK